ncbi:MAG: hypothetical protein ACP5R5_06190 [Armatimonadota bacterium]
MECKLHVNPTTASTLLGDVSRPERRRSSALLGILLAVGTVVVFTQILNLPYVGDDWAILHKMAFRTPVEILQLCMDTSLLQIRPLQYLYTWAILAIFGSYSSAFHIPALIAHICTAFVVVYLLWLIVGSRAIAWIVGLLYALAINVHLAPQMWLVGSSDILGPMLIFASMALFIKDRYALSAASFLGSLLFKEFAIAMLVVLLLYAMQQNWRERGPVAALRCAAGKLWIHVLFAAPFLVYKMVFLPSPMGFPPDHPYKLALTGPHIIRNGAIYLLWLLQTVCPFLVSRPRRMLRSLASGNIFEMAMVAAFVLLVVSAAATLIVRSRMAGQPTRAHDRPHDRPPYLLLGTWAAAGLAPVYFLPNHVFAYYMAYSLPALLAIIVLVAREVFRRAGVSQQPMIRLATAAITLQFIWSSAYVAVSFREGDFMLRGARQVAAVHELLMRHHPDVPGGTTFVLEGDGIMWALRDDKAIQLWYRDRSLRVFDRRYVAIEGGRAYALRPPPGTEFPGTRIKGDRVILNPVSVVYLRVPEGSKAVELPLIDVRHSERHPEPL